MKNPVADKGLRQSARLDPFDIYEDGDYERVFKGNGFDLVSPTIVQLPQAKLNKQQRYENFHRHPRWTRRSYGSDPSHSENTSGFRIARTRK